MKYTTQDPMKLFANWYNEAKDKEINDPNAMSIATMNEDGYPNVRIVLMKDFNEKGITFYTNYNSAKGQELIRFPKSALCFHWKSLQKQVRIRGDVEQVDDKTADEYFASRPRLSQIGAWASKQSSIIEDNLEFEKRIAYYTAKYAIGNVPRPPHWSGFIVKPISFEFWQNGEFRIHKRLKYTKISETAEWVTKNLYP